MIKQQIIERLEHDFGRNGFAWRNDEELKQACGVSLRTLHRHFPSQELMVIAVLNHHHQRYMSFLSDNAPDSAKDFVTHMFERLPIWMETEAPHGSLSLGALASFPENVNIGSTVKGHRDELIQLLTERLHSKDTALAIYLLHESAVTSWPVLGRVAVQSAMSTSQLLLGTNYK